MRYVFLALNNYHLKHKFIGAQRKILLVVFMFEDKGNLKAQVKVIKKKVIIKYNI